MSAPVEPRHEPAEPLAAPERPAHPRRRATDFPNGIIPTPPVPVDELDDRPPHSHHRERRRLLPGPVDRWVLRQPIRKWLFAVVVIIVLVGSVLRFITPSHIWLDEALSIEISNRSLPHLFTALRHDGSPPLYYLLLHYWMDIFGDGDFAVRALSGVLSLATLPLAYYAGRRVARVAARFGHISPRAEFGTGVAALLLFATSPYAIRYATEARMYTLVVFLSLAFALVLARAIEAPSRRRWIEVTVVTAALAYTHYWTLLLLASVAFFLFLQARRRPQYRRICYQALAAMFASIILFLPWIPTFVFQMLHTGTPWAPPVHAEVLLDTVFSWAGPASLGALLALVLLLLAFLGFAARPAVDGLHLTLSGRVPGRYLMAMWLAPLVLAYGAYALGGSAYAERYTGISLPPFLLLAALGIGLLPSRAAVAGLLALISVAGLIGGESLNAQERTNASEVATRIQQQARPGDVVAYCPDQLAPALHRMLQRDGVTGIKEIAFADASGPALVDWVDYQKRMSHASATAFAKQIDKLAGNDGSIYLVSAGGYRTLGDNCSEVSDQLAALGRDRVQQVSRRSLLESSMLERFSTKR